MDYEPPPPPPPPISCSSGREDKSWMRSNTAMPPPPPPLPPPGLIQSSKPTHVVPPPPPMPSEEAFTPIDKAHYFQFLKDTKANMPGEPFQPFYMFFYGSLMDPEVLQAILDLPELPTMQPATISGFSIKMWGIYPTLIPCLPGTGSVTGTVWKATLEDHFDRLAAYETAAYRWDECEAVLEDGEVYGNCRTFCWAGEPDSKELEDGSFDLERYQKYFKSSVTRRRSPNATF
ncbi:hypothetical protein VTL71DRAFT_13388 [Oculimacula yallundae]|uniref:Putative gamma-glutamylcyclotransferase n=1 Tax=Oculimacula yallundae TaxID=86028 RepID=A0ABR4CKU2_9HELO